MDRELMKACMSTAPIWPYAVLFGGTVFLTLLTKRSNGLGVKDTLLAFIGIRRYKLNLTQMTVLIVALLAPLVGLFNHLQGCLASG